MTENVNLAKYLPPFLAEFKELAELFSAENPEFDLLHGEVRRVLDDQYIKTAGERGVARLEKITGIPTDRSLTLDARKTRIITRINEELPYTLRKLNELLAAVCGEGNFSIFGDFPNYAITVTTERLSSSQIVEVERLLDNVIPANIITNTQNQETVKTDGGDIIFTVCLSDHRSVIIDTA